MDTRAASKVGVMVLLGMALFGAAWYFLAHVDLNHYKLYAKFADIRGLQKQSPIRMNGVTIGEVRDVRLERGDLRPVVVLSIDNRYLHQIPDDSVIRITSGLLISNPQLEIQPGISRGTLAPGQEWPQRYVEAEPVGALAQLSPEADKAVKQLTVTMQTLTPRLTRTMDRLDGILKHTDAMMVNFQDASVSARNLLTDPKIRQTMHASLDDLQAVSHDARVTAHTLSVELRGVVRRNSGKFDELANGAVDLLQKFADTVDAARGAVTRLTEQVSDPRLQQSLVETLDLAKTTIARFNQIASDIHQLTGDPNVQSDLKSTVATLRETTAEGQRLVERVNSLVGAVKVPGGRTNLGIGRPGFSIDLLARANAPHFRSDINMRVPIGANNAFDLGLYDFAETYKLNAQYETRLSRTGSFRYGIYASKLGVGLDLPVTSGSTFRLDAYNPNNLQLDARGSVRINDDFALWFGADSLFKRTTPLVGVRLQR